ncbi:MAG: trigger factor, partial [Bacteroidaceae bacterium]|nr:trigger factor [Bacteroidaceae bacterium]
MNISFENVDKVSALLTVNIEKADYADKVKAALKDFSKKASLPGFRPGKVPASLIQKRFGTEIKADEINKILGEEVNKYIRENKINMLAEPMPNEEKTPAIDFETQEDFTFAFDIALAPEFDAKLSKKDKLTYYDIKVDDAIVDQQVQSYCQRGGQHVNVESFAANDMVKGTLTQLNTKNNTLEGGITVEDAVMLPGYMKNDKEKAKFEGAKVGDVVTFNPAKAYDNNVTELSSLLHITKEEAEGMKSNFGFQVSEIIRYVPAQPTQELFDRVLGQGVVKSEEEFREFIRGDIKRNFNSEAEYQFIQDLREYLLGRIGEVEFPEALLKRFMKLRNQDKGEEYVEENFEKTLPELLWSLAKEQICEQLDIKVEQEDVLETAKAFTRIQFASYGMVNLPEESITNYANEMLKNEQQAQGIAERTIENKVAAKAKEAITLKVKEVTMDEFRKL